MMELKNKLDSLCTSCRHQLSSWLFQALRIALSKDLFQASQGTFESSEIIFGRAILDIEHNNMVSTCKLLPAPKKRESSFFSVIESLRRTN